MILLLSNLFAFHVFAENAFVEIATIGDFKAKDSIKITGTCTTGKDIVIRIYNEKNSVIYTDVFPAYDNEDGIFEFGGFSLPAEDYTVVVSVSGTTAIDKDDMKVVKNGGDSKNNGGDGDSYVMRSWDKKEENTDTNKDESKQSEEENKATEETLNEKAIKGASEQKTVTAGVKYIKETTKGTSKAALKKESTRNTIAVSVETMMANIGSKKISTPVSNTLVLKESSVSESELKKYSNTEKSLMAAVSDSGITLNRELTKEYIVNTNFNKSKNATIEIHKGFVTKLDTIGIEVLTVNDENFRISYETDEIHEMIGAEEKLLIEINPSAMTSTSKKLTVNFDTDKTKSVKISFPGLKGDSSYMAIVDENGNPVGGRYNPATGAIEAKISESGVYQVVNNEKDFDDIKHLSEEMQESIKILAAKGIIEGTSAKEFSPEDSISRAEVAALLLRVLSQVDPNADGGFADVKKSDWFYGTAGSAKAYGMILGFEDNTFRGNVTIAKDQILAIASRVLQREMKYITPDKPEEWLTFTDASSIADWAEKDIALTTMANIVTRTADNTIHADEDMTRGDAALIIMRLFYKIW